MRKNIYDVLKNGKVDIRAEYSRIYSLFYKSETVYGMYLSLEEIIKREFCELPRYLIKRCLSLEDFNKTYGYNFLPQPNDFSIETLIDISEYVINFVIALMNSYSVNVIDNDALYNVVMHIESCMEDICYKRVDNEEIIIFVENNPAAVSVSEMVEPQLSYAVLEYNHYKLKGDLERKKSILWKMADDIEPERSRLRSINKSFESDLFQLINTFIRHNNSKKECISEMTDAELEEAYDDIYQMWLLAKLQLEHNQRSNSIKELIKKINCS